MLYSVEFFDSETEVIEVLYRGPDLEQAKHIYSVTFLQWETDHKSLTETDHKSLTGTKCLKMNHHNPLWLKNPDIELTGKP